MRSTVVLVGACGMLATAAACSSSSPHPKPVTTSVEVSITNGNKDPIHVSGAPIKPFEIEGCLPNGCSDSTAEQTGGGVGWTETRSLPRQYRIVLDGKPLRCPILAKPPTTKVKGMTFRYDIETTTTGRCIRVSPS